MYAKAKLPNVSSPRGAPMGRVNTITLPDAPIIFYMTRMPLVDGDYDQGGAYWGYVQGTQMYWARGAGDWCDDEMFVRAKCRDDAKTQIKVEFPNARFFK